MSTTSTEKSCGPATYPAELPAHDWDVQRLGDYAQRLYQVILTNERSLAPFYWMLGQALILARKSFHRGHWNQYLASLGIDRTRSSKACAIYRRFASVEEVTSMTVEEAYEARRHSSPATPGEEHAGTRHQAVLPVKLGKALIKAETTAAAVFENTAHLTQAEKLELLKSLRQTIACLQAHAECLEAAINGDFEDMIS